MLQARKESHTDRRRLKTAPTFDEAAVEAAIFDLLVAAGEDPHRGVIVVVEAERLCTSAVRGEFKDDAASRADALHLLLHE